MVGALHFEKSFIVATLLVYQGDRCFAESVPNMIADFALNLTHQRRLSTFLEISRCRIVCDPSGTPETGPFS